MLNKNNKIAQSVINWTDQYFHQSAFDIPLKFPSNKTMSFLSKFKNNGIITLFRGVNKFNQNNFTGIESWTHDRSIAKRYAQEQKGKIIKKNFTSKNILLDTALLNKEEKTLLGYDYRVDDREVLIINKV